MSQDEIDKIISNLIKHQYVVAVINNEPVTFRFSPDFKKIDISVPVFRGGNFLPHSVRRAIYAKTVFSNSTINTRFTVDENNFMILLNFTQSLENGFGDFEEWLEQFLWISEEWRNILERYGREDLVFVYINKN